MLSIQVKAKIRLKMNHHILLTYTRAFINNGEIANELRAQWLAPKPKMPLKKKKS